jgi:hypothetical protein
MKSFDFQGLNLTSQMSSFERRAASLTTQMDSFEIRTRSLRNQMKSFVLGPVTPLGPMKSLEIWLPNALGQVTSLARGGAGEGLDVAPRRSDAARPRSRRRAVGVEGCPVGPRDGLVRGAGRCVRPSLVVRRGVVRTRFGGATHDVSGARAARSGGETSAFGGQMQRFGLDPWPLTADWRPPPPQTCPGAGPARVVRRARQGRGEALRGPPMVRARPKLALAHRQTRGSSGCLRAGLARYAGAAPQ